MRQLILILVGVLFFYEIKAQNAEDVLYNPITCANNFQKYSNDGFNADSAFFYIQQLALNEQNIFLLKSLLHNSFAQNFIRSDNMDDYYLKKEVVGKEILMKIISDTNKLLLETVKPLYLWVEVQSDTGNAAAVTNFTNEFINTQLASGNLYNNSIGRYGLLIYQTISKNKELKILSEKLFSIIYDNLKNNQIIATDSSSRNDLEQRADYRYLFAYVNYIKAKQSNNSDDKKHYLQQAFDYSPDITDKNNNTYSFDMVLLFHGGVKETFKPEYLAFLANSNKNNPQVLSILLQAALVEPEYKNQLKEFYNKNNSTSKSFDVYWIEAINKNAKKAPAVALNLLDKKLFSSNQLLGKWILIDFWATWCIPCRADHPAMQQFYDSIVLKNAGSISFLTIACDDTEKKVVDYLNENHFNFPVAMSDNKIEKAFSVQGFPSKILITPQGKYIVVPFGSNVWINFVTQYCSL